MSQLITVGLPVFNGMPYLPETIASLLAQTHEDFTLLVIDDGSTDGSLQYLKTIKDPRLQLHTQQNAGITSTLNRMLQIARTPWLARHDADDIAYPRRFERTVEFIRRYPSAGMFYSDADYYPMKKGQVKFRSTRGDPHKLREITRAGYLLAICHPSVTLNIQKARSVGGYRFDLHVEDVDLWWRMALDFDIHYIPEVLVGMRQNQASSSWRNLEPQAVNALYAQYLLVASLSNLAPRSHEEVYPLLFDMLDRSKLELKRNLRAANFQFSQARHAQGLLSIARAFFSSPAGFFARIHYGLFPQPNVRNGEDPALLLARCGDRGIEAQWAWCRPALPNP